jgi:hypothetical protein
MGSKDPRVDAYIANAQPFAKPILKHLRRVVHDACPSADETMKWSFPHFEYKGMLCSMAAFKEHCAFGFWNQSILSEEQKSADAMGQFGRLTTVADLPAERTLAGLVKKAAALNDQGVKPKREAKPPRPPLKAPAYLTDALRKNKPSPIRHVSAGSRPRSNGWLKARSATGSTPRGSRPAAPRRTIIP